MWEQLLVSNRLKGIQKHIIETIGTKRWKLCDHTPIVEAKPIPYDIKPMQKVGIKKERIIMNNPVFMKDQITLK